MATQKTSGTQTAVVTTTHTLATVTDAGTYVLAVDLSNMVNGDIVELVIETKLLTGSTSAVAYKATFAHIQGQPIQHSVPVPVPFQLIAKLTQTDGTAVDFDWAIYEP